MKGGMYWKIAEVVPYIGTWIETLNNLSLKYGNNVVPYIGTWIETPLLTRARTLSPVVPYIGTWIETYY